MNNVRILQLLNENKIEQLKQLLKEEISISNSDNKNVTKSIIKLSKLVKKEMNFIPLLAGAWINESNQQCICNGAFAVRYNTIINGTENASNNGEHLNLSKLFPSTNNINEYFNIDLNNLINKYKIAKAEKHNNITTELNGTPFNAEYLINILNTFINPQCTIIGDMLYIKADNGDGILLRLRIQKEHLNKFYII